MYLVKMLALRPLRGDYLLSGNTLVAARVDEGQTFTTDNENAERLEAEGLAERYREPQHAITFAELEAEEKATGPMENKALQPAENNAATVPRSGVLGPLLDKIDADLKRNQRARRHR